MPITPPLKPISFIFLGIISIFGQAVLLREITTLFYGNELFYGLGLSLWLLFTGLGSLWAGRFKSQTKNSIGPILLIILIFLLPLLIIGLRWLTATQIAYGHLPDPGFSLTAVTVCLFLFCFPLGASFPLLLSGWKQKSAPNQGYFWETIGFALGGLIFSLILATSSFPLTKPLNRLTQTWRYPRLTTNLNSRYNQIVITEKNQQQTFIFNGQPSFTSEEKLQSDQLISLVIPWTNRPQTALVLGNPNLARQLQSQFVNQVQFLEIDAQALQLEKKLLTNQIKPILADFRRFLNQTSPQWDLIIFSPGNPTTLLTNRYFTKESFLAVKKHLNNNGVFSLAFYLPTDYQSQEATRFAASIYQALNSVFPYLELLTLEDQIILIASPNPLQLHQHQLQPHLQHLFQLSLNDPQRQSIAAKLQSANIKINTDLEPSAFFYQQLFWQTIFSFQLPKIVNQLTQFLPFFLLALFWLILQRSSSHWKLGWLTACSGFIFISLEVLIIFLFQIKIGYLYQQLSLILASALLGMAAGVKLNQTNLKNLNLKTIWLIYPLIMLTLTLCLSTSLANYPGSWLLIIGLTGLTAGLLFARLNQRYLQQRQHLGFIYAFDLFGGSLGAILTSGLILPAYGVKGLLLGLTSLILLTIATRLE